MSAFGSKHRGVQDAAMRAAIAYGDLTPEERDLVAETLKRRGETLRLLDRVKGKTNEKAGQDDEERRQRHNGPAP